MKNINLFSVKSKLMLIAIGLTLIWIILGIILYNYLNRIQEFNDLSANVNNFSVNIIQLRKAENNFLLVEQLNPYFYNSGKSKFLDKFKTHYNLCIKDLNELIDSKIINDFQLSGKLISIRQNLKEYQETFNTLVKNIRERGYLDYGLIGEMNVSIQKIENTILSYPESYSILNEKILVLRKYEKDFLSLKDLAYSENFTSTIETYKKFFIDVRTTLNPSLRERFLSELDVYRDKFNQVAKKEQVIGLTFEDGLIGQSQSVVSKVENNVEEILQQIKHKNVKAIVNIKLSLFFSISFLAVSIVIILLFILKSITTPIAKIKEYISELVDGKFPQLIHLNNKDEITEMSEALNSFVEHLRAKAIFSKEIGLGKFEAEFTAVSLEDTLGNSLLKMRDDLKKAAEDDRQRKMEDEKQVWATRGLAKFNDILRQDTGNINLLSYSIIKNLVDFLNANQGGIFIFNDDDNTDLHLQLVACYAYNKQKRLNKKIKLREGLVGTCAVEKATTYIKQVPHNYINITSGLGKATPQSLLLVPLVLNELIFGVIEIASLNNFQEHEIKFVEKLSENVAATLSLVKTNERTNRLLTQFQLQSEDLAAKEEEMRQNLEELQSIQENLTNQQNYMNDLRYALDNAIIEAEFEPGGTVLRINKRFTESTGYTEKELLGEKIFIIIYGKEKDTFEHLWDNLLLGLPYKGIMKTKVKNGKERWYHANYTPVLNEVGKVYKIFYMAQDITDIKRLELELYDREASLEIKLKRLETEVNILKKELEIHSTKKITQRI